MWNAMKTKALVSAVLITATIQGSLLWRMDGVAAEGASKLAQASAGNVVATATDSPAQTRYVTLEPVLVVGRRSAPAAEPTTARANLPAPAAPDVSRPGTAEGIYIW